MIKGDRANLRIDLAVHLSLAISTQNFNDSVAPSDHALR
jgi:hypothetical protein